MILRDAVKANDARDDDDGSGNSGMLTTDATCAPSNIRYPQDVSLLNEAWKNAEKLLNILHDPADGKKSRNYCKLTREDYLKYIRSRKHAAQKTRKAICKQPIISGAIWNPLTPS